MPRTDPDSCPGALRLHQAADGPLARIRLPGGLLTSAQVQLLAEAARDLAVGSLELTSRANIQLRGVRDAAELARRLESGLLLPSAAHERVRNIVASPLSGRRGGIADVRPLVAALDEGLRSRAALAALPGRVLFTVDDGRGDVSGLIGDIGLHAVSSTEFTVLLAGADAKLRVGSDAAIELALAAAAVFAEIRTDEWRLAEIDGGVRRVLQRLGYDPDASTPLRFAAEPAVPIGWLEQADGLVALGAGVRFGSLDARVAEFLAATERPLIVTPWRGVVLCDLDEWAAEQVVRVLAPLGLIFDAESPWLRVSACAGRPGCAHALGDVREDAAAAVESGELPTSGRSHWAGCERRCGRPRGPVVDVVATTSGTYRVGSC